MDPSREQIHPYGQPTTKADGLKSPLELPICSNDELNPPPIIHRAEDLSLDSSLNRQQITYQIN